MFEILQATDEFATRTFDEEEHEYLIYAEDIELNAVGDNSLHGKRLNLPN